MSLKINSPTGSKLFTHLQERVMKMFSAIRSEEGGVSNELIKEMITNPESTAVFACGPDHSTHQKKAAREKGETLKPTFMTSVLSYLDELGVPKNKIKKESYG